MGPHSQIFLYYPTIAFSLQSSLSLSYSLKTNNHNTTFFLPTRQDRSLSLSRSLLGEIVCSLFLHPKKSSYIYIFIYVLFIYFFYTLSRLGLVVGVGVGVVMVASVGFSLFPSMDGYGVVVLLWVWI